MNFIYMKPLCYHNNNHVSFMGVFLQLISIMSLFYTNANAFKTNSFLSLTKF